MLAATDTLLKPVRVRDVSLRGLQLKDGERIEAIEVEVAHARFRNVHIPDDWGIDVGPPEAGVSVLKGVAQHGTAMLFTSSEFQRFLTLAFYDYGAFDGPFTIKVKLTHFRYDNVKGESERTLDLSSRNIVLEEPDQLPASTSKAVTPRAGPGGVPSSSADH
jgi:hypothetical protein